MNGTGYSVHTCGGIGGGGGGAGAGGGVGPAGTIEARPASLRRHGALLPARSAVQGAAEKVLLRKQSLPCVALPVVSLTQSLRLAGVSQATQAQTPRQSQRLACSKSAY